MSDPIPAVVEYGIYLYFAAVCSIGVALQVWIHRGRRRRTRSAVPDANGAAE